MRELIVLFSRFSTHTVQPPRSQISSVLYRVFGKATPKKTSLLEDIMHFYMLSLLHCCLGRRRLGFQKTNLFPNFQCLVKSAILPEF